MALPVLSLASETDAPPAQDSATIRAFAARGHNGDRSLPGRTTGQWHRWPVGLTPGAGDAPAPIGRSTLARNQSGIWGPAAAHELGWPKAGT
jgi:hypothetical protein